MKIILASESGQLIERYAKDMRSELAHQRRIGLRNKIASVFEPHNGLPASIVDELRVGKIPSKDYISDARIEEWKRVQYLTTTQIWEILGGADVCGSLRFLGQQLKYMGFHRDGKNRWMVKRVIQT